MREQGKQLNGKYNHGLLVLSCALLKQSIPQGLHGLLFNVKTEAAMLLPGKHSSPKCTLCIP